MAISPTVTITLRPEARERVGRLAEARNLTAASVVSEAVDQYLDRREKREEFLKSGVNAWEDYQATGLHLTGDEIDAWIEKLGVSDTAPMPECHT